MLKFILYCIILYYVLRVARNLVRAILQRSEPSRIDARERSFGNPPAAHPSQPVPRRAMYDVEDARWEDLS